MARLPTREPLGSGRADVDATVASAARAAPLDGVGVERAEECVREHRMLLPLAPGEALEPVRRAPRGARLDGPRKRADNPCVRGDALASGRDLDAGLEPLGEA